VNASLTEYLSTRIALDETEQNAVSELLETKEFKRSHYLLKEGEVSNAFFFLQKGCIRLFYNVDGDEKSAFFYTEGQFVSSYESFIKQSPCNHYLQCVEDCEVVVIGFEAAEALLKLSPKFDALARIMMEEELALYQRIVASYVTQNPEKRYQQFSSENPHLMQRLPQHYIASYLGVSAETLSRIKKRVLSRTS